MLAIKLITYGLDFDLIDAVRDMRYNITFL